MLCILYTLLLSILNNFNISLYIIIGMSVDITFLIPCYNCEKTIERTINSIINQNYKNGKIRICCVNDGSRDNTYAKLLKIKKNIKFKMEVYSQSNKGLAGVRTELLKHVKTDYFMFIDSDDYFFDNKCISAIVNSSENGMADITLSQNRIVYGKKKSSRYSYT
jgi:glycosyltransferase involved in cell wall biosynthesis